MIKVQRMFWAAVDATHDRRFVAKSANKKLKGIDVNLYKAITKTSGQPTDSFVQECKNWKRAYNSNILRLLQLEKLNEPFKNPSTLSKVVDYVASSLGKNRTK